MYVCINANAGGEPPRVEEGKEGDLLAHARECAELVYVTRDVTCVFLFQNLGSLLDVSVNGLV
jgi:hypothetical protein